jgi:hypothetical protein
LHLQEYLYRCKEKENKTESTKKKDRKEEKKDNYQSS